MENLIEITDEKTGRKIFQYIGNDGVKGKIVPRRQHLVELRAQGKLINFDLSNVLLVSRHFSVMRAVFLTKVWWKWLKRKLETRLWGNCMEKRMWRE